MIPRNTGYFSDRNSDAAQAYAAKKKEQLARANAMRLERERMDRGTALACLEVNPGINSVGTAGVKTSEMGELSGRYQQTKLDVGGFEVESRSYGTTTERIVIRPSAGSRVAAERKQIEPPPHGGLPQIARSQRDARSMPTPPFRSASTELQVPDAVFEIGNGMQVSCPRSQHVYNSTSETFLLPPSDPSGSQVDLSDRPILCVSSNGSDEVVFGCADHALYAVNIDCLLGTRPGRPKTMYNKQYGHTDWVTSVAHLADGRVLSAAMDSKLCLWDSSRTRCTDLTSGHSKSVAKVVADVRYNIAMSCGYDGLVALWSFGESNSSNGSGSSSSGRVGAGTAKRGAAPQRRTSAAATATAPAAILSGHGDPVLECTYNGSVCATGARNGGLIFWDLNTCEAISKIRAHRGSVTALEALPGSGCFLTAGVDGLVKLWDPREKTASLTIPAHAGEVSRTPPTMIAGGAGGGGASRVLSSGGATAVRGGGSSSSQGAASGGRGGGTSSSSSSSSSLTTKVSGRAAGDISSAYESGGGGSVHGSRGGGGCEVAAAAIACMCVLRREGGGGASLVVTGGADSNVCVLDVRMNYSVVYRWQHHKSGLYSMCALGDSCVVTGDGAGMMLAYDCVGINSSDAGVRYGLGASGQGAVRGIVSIGNSIVAAGEDGKVLSYLY